MLILLHCHVRGSKSCSGNLSSSSVGETYVARSGKHELWLLSCKIPCQCHTHMPSNHKARRSDTGCSLQSHWDSFSETGRDKFTSECFKSYLRCLKHPCKVCPRLSQTHALLEQCALLEAMQNSSGHVRWKWTPVGEHLSKALSSLWQLKGKWSLLNCVLCWEASENIYTGYHVFLAHILFFSSWNRHLEKHRYKYRF